MIQRKLNSFAHAFNGFKIAYSEEANFRIQLAIAALTGFLGLWLGLSANEWLLVVAIGGLVLTAELLNTALEELCDMMQNSPDPHVGKIKDLAAAAVLVSSFAAVVVGVIIFAPKVLSL